MITQDKKQIVDIGEIGNASTGDILYDGGKKINENFDGIYNAFADQRFFATNQGEGQQVIHATGYYQKVNATTIAGPIALGSQFDVSTSAGAAFPILPKGVKGEGVIFVNTDGSISPTNALVIQPNSRFVGISGSLKVTSPFVRVECWCISDDAGVPVWDYSITSLFGEKHISLDKTYLLAQNANREIRIAHKDEFNVIKLLLTATNTDNSKLKTSEVNLLVNTVTNKVTHTEYASMRIGFTDSEDEIYTADYIIDALGYVTLVSKTTIAGLRLAVKTINTQKFKVAI